MLKRTRSVLFVDGRGHALASSSFQVRQVGSRASRLCSATPSVGASTAPVLSTDAESTPSAHWSNRARRPTAEATIRLPECPTPGTTSKVWRSRIEGPKWSIRCW